MMSDVPCPPKKKENPIKSVVVRCPSYFPFFLFFCGQRIRLGGYRTNRTTKQDRCLTLHVHTHRLLLLYYFCAGGKKERKKEADEI